MIRKVVLGAVLLAVLALNPMFGYFARFQYSEADMRHAVEGRWKLTVDNQDHEMTIRETGVKQHASRGIMNSAAACGTRSFVNAAEACSDESSMDVDVTSGDVTTRGRFYVFGTTFERGSLAINADGFDIDARIDDIGNVLGVTIMQHGNHVTGALERL